MYNILCMPLKSGRIKITVRNTIMIKRICVLLLALSLAAAAVGCRPSPDGPAQPDTSAPSENTDSETNADTAPDTETDTPPASEETSDTSEPESPLPEPPPVTVVASYFETVTVDGVPCLTGDGDRDQLLTAAGNRITIPDGADAVALSVTGWIGFDCPIDTFGFSVDGDATFGNFSLYTEDNVRVVGGAYALRFAIHVPVFDLNPGAHTIQLLARLHNGTVVNLRQSITLQMGGLVADTAIPYHATLTHLNGTACKDGAGNSASGMASVSGEGARVGDDGRMTVSGWLATEGGIDRYVWSADGITWYDAETDGTTGEPDGTSFSSLGYTDAAVNALFTGLTLNLSPYDGQTVDITLGAVPRNSTDKVIPFVRITALSVPDQINDIACSFRADASVNPTGTDLRASDLMDVFTVNYGVGEPRSVVDAEGSICYALSGIHEIYAGVDGRYALSAKFLQMDPSSFLFVRGYHAVISDDLLENGDAAKGQFHVNTFYETDSAGAMGGAGIYATLGSGKLTVMVKYYDPNCISRIGNHFTEIACSGSTLTLYDDGTNVSVYVDGKLRVTVQLEGSVSYPDINNIAPYGTFASTAVISVAGGKSTTIRNTLVASTCLAQCGLTIRGGSVYFTDLTLLPPSEAGLPNS